MRILFVSSEMAPLAKSGGLGDVVSALPQALRALGHDCRVVIPLYKQIKDQYMDQLHFRRWSMINMGWRTMYTGLFEMDVMGVPVYLIDNEYYFGHDGIYLDYAFDIERFSFFQRAVLEALGEPMGFEPDILHLNDWQTGMIPVTLEAHYKSHDYHKDLCSILTIHNLKFQGIHGRERILDLFDLPEKYMNESAVLKDGVPNFLKAGITFSNRVTTVSPSYAEEIMMDYYGEGLNGILGAQRWKVCGILNGIDSLSYDPTTDRALSKNYGLKDWRKGKAANKTALQAQLGLEVNPELPLLCMISRLTDQKGIDLLLYVVDEILDMPLQLVVIGTGEARYEDGLRHVEERHPDKMRALIEFDEALSRQLYAASDLLLMPSVFEPCGLSQMLAMRYGALPIVRETGGLRDTVRPYNKFDGSGNGFSFSNINAHELLYTCQHAAALYYNERAAWDKLVESALQEDFSWRESALKYIELYREILRENGHAEAAERVENPPAAKEGNTPAERVEKALEEKVENAPPEPKELSLEPKELEMEASSHLSKMKADHETATKKTTSRAKKAASRKKTGISSKSGSSQSEGSTDSHTGTGASSKTGRKTSRSKTSNTSSRSKNSGSKTKKPANPRE